MYFKRKKALTPVPFTVIQKFTHTHITAFRNMTKCLNFGQTSCISDGKDYIPGHYQEKHVYLSAVYTETVNVLRVMTATHKVAKCIILTKSAKRFGYKLASTNVITSRTNAANNAGTFRRWPSTKPCFVSVYTHFPDGFKKQYQSIYHRTSSTLKL